MPGVLELGAEQGEVLDDPVVHQGDPAALAEVRVRVAVVGGAVGGPAGVPDAGRGLGEGLSASALSRLASFPARFSEAMLPAWTKAIPAES